MKSDPQIRKTAPDWNQFKKTKSHADLALEEYIQALNQKKEHQIDATSSDCKDPPTITATPLSSKPSSPNSSQIKLLPRNQLNSKVLKWISDKQTHVLTLLNGKVEYVSMKDSLGLGAADLQDLM